MLDWLLRRVSRVGLRRGFGGEPRAWLVIAFAAVGASPSPASELPVALSVPIKVGDRLLVTLADPGTPRAGKP